MSEDTGEQAEAGRYFKEITLRRRKGQRLSFHILEFFCLKECPRQSHLR